MGEAEFDQKPLAKAVSKALAEQESDVQRVMTPGGKFQVRWDEDGSAIALGQLPFFAEYLDVTGLFERWVESKRHFDLEDPDDQARLFDKVWAHLYSCGFIGCFRNAYNRCGAESLELSPGSRAVAHSTFSCFQIYRQKYRQLLAARVWFSCGVAQFVMCYQHIRWQLEVLTPVD